MAAAKKPVAQKGGRIYVFSTLTNDQHYLNWAKGPSDMPVESAGVLIKGGTGIANDRLITPLGVCTEISEEELKQLEQNGVFKLHQENGHILVRKSKADPEKVATDMVQDQSSPLTPADYMNAGENDVAEPTTGKAA